MFHIHAFLSPQIDNSSSSFLFKFYSSNSTPSLHHIHGASVGRRSRLFHFALYSRRPVHAHAPSRGEKLNIMKTGVRNNRQPRNKKISTAILTASPCRYLQLSLNMFCLCWQNRKHCLSAASLRTILTFLTDRLYSSTTRYRNRLQVVWLFEIFDILDV